MKVKKLVKANISQLFTVEKVLDKKQKSGKTFFLIKWQSYSDDFNSWEPKSNLMLCPELIEEYEKEHAKEARCTEENPHNKRKKINSFQKKDINEIKGIPKEVIGIVERKDSPSDFNFFIEYEDGRASVVARKVAHESELCQQVIIKYYEENLVWTEDEKREMNEISEASSHDIALT